MRILFLPGLSVLAAGWSLAAQCQTPASPEPGEVFRDCPDCAEMVVVPPGDFSMGSPETPYEKPEHRVTIAQPFAIGRREVTFEEWDQCIGALACKYPPDDRGWGRAMRPAIDVSWDDAKVFIAGLSQKAGKRYRLPSEAEWEYAARAGTTTAYWWGRAADKGRANCEDCAATPTRQTTPSGTFRPNGFGLFDVAGATRPSGSGIAGMTPIAALRPTARCGPQVSAGSVFCAAAPSRQGQSHSVGGALPVRSGRSLLRQRLPRGARSALAHNPEKLQTFRTRSCAKAKR